MHKRIAMVGPVSLLLVSGAFAADLPLRKSGLWEIRTDTRADGRALPGPMTMRLCIDQRKDDMMADPRAQQDMRRRCSKMDVKRAGNTVTIDSVCSMDGHVATGRTVISGSLTADYRMENTTRFSPPMQGMQAMQSTATGKWLGPCKPGQQHGSTTMSGMPGMGPGGFKMDPETMQRLQQQYGR
ncbi:MAG: DUF3617 family protein [Pseudomonadota bacterium]